MIIKYNLLKYIAKPECLLKFYELKNKELLISLLKTNLFNKLIYKRIKLVK